MLVLVIGISSCIILNNSRGHSKKQKVTTNVKSSELKRILESGELRVVVDYNSTNYFVYKGQPMGFQYELLKAFADQMGVSLKLQVSNSIQESFAGLNTGEYDLIAKNLTVTKERSDLVDFTNPFALTRQVLVQRIPELDPEKTEIAPQPLIREQLQLAGKTIYVQKNTVFVQRLKNLSDEIGEPITIVEDTLYGVEQLIALVAKGEIDYTVCDENVGLVNQKYYPWIDVSTPISFNQKLSWAVRKNSPDWKEYLDGWIDEYKNTSEYKYLYYKYFAGARSQMVYSDFHSITGGMISEYDQLIRQVAASYNWDWRLIASIIMQESNFNRYAESWMGAMGLMQLMPETAKQYNIDYEEITEPRENIRGGLEYLTWLDEVFQPIITDRDERLKFVLASYNVGIGHVMDARKLAMKYGKDPGVWRDNVDNLLVKKSTPQYYKDPLVRWGYCRGEEPYNYVIEVLDRYQHYLNVLPDENNDALVSLPVLQSSWR